MTKEFAIKIDKFKAEYEKMKVKLDEAESTFHELHTRDSHDAVIERRRELRGALRSFREDLYSAYEYGDCTLNEYFDALESIGTYPWGPSFKLIDGLELEFGVRRDSNSKRIRFCGYTHDLDEYGYDTPTAIRGQIEYLEHELEEEIKRDPESEYVMDIKSEIDEYRADLLKAVEKEKNEFIDEKKALDLAAFFTKLAEELRNDSRKMPPL